jgi:hypothetical protein
VRKLIAVVILAVVVLVGTTVAMRPGTAAAATGPSEPGAITVSNITSTSVSLAWGKSKDTLGIEGYRVYRQLSGGPLEMIETTDAIADFVPIDLRSNSTYTFGVTGIDVANAESPMQTTTVTTATSTDTSVPAPPSNASLSIKAFSSTRLDVLWGKSPSSNVAYYEVVRNGTRIATVDVPNAPRYSDNGLTPTTSYSYAIDAVSSTGARSALTAVKAGTTTAPGSVNIARGPVLSNVTASAAVVSWWTNIPTSGVLSVAGQSLTDPSGPVQHHEIAVSGLTAATSYPYSVSSADPTTNHSATSSGTLTTAALPGQTFSFAAMGDYGGGGPGENNNAANIGTAGTQFIQTLGDNIYPSSGLPDPDFTTTYSDFDDHFYKELGPDVKNQAFFPANGNKDYYSNGQFWVNFPMLGTNHEWYSYNWGDAHILVLDSEQPMGPGSDQYAFAQNDLATNQSEKWRIVAVQRPPYSSTTDNSSSKFAQALIPLFQGYRVNLVLSGNSHNYERSFPLYNGVEDTSKGITYIVSGGGGSGFNKFTSAFPEPAWSAVRESDFWEFAKITVSPTSIQENAIRADTDTVFDSTTVNPLPADSTAPTTPTGLVAAGSTASTVTLDWTPDPVTDGVTGYDIYRNGVKVGSTSGTAISYTDTGLTAGTTYQYAIDGKDGSGNVSSRTGTIAVATPAAAQATLVQTAGSATSTVVLPAASKPGDLLVLSAGVFTGASAEISSVTDSAGNTWKRIGAYTVHGVNADGELWYAPDAASAVSVTVTTAATTVALRVAEYSGVATSNPLDMSAGSAATGTSAASGPVTPTATNDLAVGFVAGHSSAQPITVSSSGYLLQPEVIATKPSTTTVQTGYRLLGSTAKQGFAATFPAAMYWSSGIALFRTASPPPPSNDFALAVSPNTATVKSGATTAASVTSSIVSGVAERVSLTAAGPSGVSISFSPQTINSGNSSTMTVTTTTSTAAGTYPITITGIASSGTHTSTFSLVVPAASATPRLVQTASGTETTASTSLLAQMSTPTTAGDLLVLSASDDVGATNHITSVTDSANNTWTRIGAYYVTSHNSEGEMWYAAAANPTSSVTIHMSTASSSAIEVEEFSGMAAVNSLDVAAGSAADGTAATSGSATSSGSAELAVGFIAGHSSKQAIYVGTAGYTAQPQVTTSGVGASTEASVVTGYQVLTQSGPQNFGGSFGASMYWAAGVAVFRAA